MAFRREKLILGENFQRIDEILFDILLILIRHRDEIRTENRSAETARVRFTLVLRRRSVVVRDDFRLKFNGGKPRKRRAKSMSFSSIK